MTTLIWNARKIDADGIVEDFWVTWSGTRIVETGVGNPPQAVTTIDAEGKWLTPGFIDLHCHGGAGLAFGDLDVRFAEALAPHRHCGTTRSVLSIVSNSFESMLASLEEVARYSLIDDCVIGSHLEGPFLSPLHRGAHDPKHLVEPTTERVDAILSAANGTLAQITLAPELPGSLEAITAFVARGVRVGIGHTNATCAEATQAFGAGATLLTHTFNAMRSLHHREPGPVMAAFEDDRVTLELILDGEHLVPSVAGLVFREASGRVALVTDAMAAAGLGDGDYRLGTLGVTVLEGRAVLTGTETLAGSTLTQDVSLRAAIERSGIPPVEAVTALTLTPARAMGLDAGLGVLRPGFLADAVLLDDKWCVERVWANGHLVR